MMNSTLSRYLFAGLVNTLIGYIVFLILFNLFTMSASIANTISYACGLISAYILNKIFVFKVSEKNKKRAILFILCFCIAFLVNQIVLHIFSQFINANFAQIIAMTSYTLLFYFLNKFVVFRNNRHHD